MRFVSRFAAWGPHVKKGDTLDHSDALKSAFVVSLSCVFASQEVAIEEQPEIGEVDSMLLKIDPPLRSCLEIPVSITYVVSAWLANS